MAKSGYKEPDPDLVHMGELIREARLKKNMTQSDLAFGLGTSTATISEYEAGTQEMKWRRVCEISHLLDIPIDTLVAETDEHETGSLDERLEKDFRAAAAMDDVSKEHICWMLETVVTAGKK